jgi:hypothetical protein
MFKHKLDQVLMCILFARSKVDKLSPELKFRDIITSGEMHVARMRRTPATAMHPTPPDSPVQKHRCHTMPQSSQSVVPMDLTLIKEGVAEEMTTKR